MMFAVYGYIMMIGAMVGENDAVFGNAMMGSVFAVLMLVVFKLAMQRRKKAHILFNSTISNMLTADGFIEATNFATTTGVSVDDARDILDKQMVEHHWSREEKSQYNALYFPPK